MLIIISLNLQKLDIIIYSFFTNITKGLLVHTKKLTVSLQIRGFWWLFNNSIRCFCHWANHGKLLLIWYYTQATPAGIRVPL